jgi:hypothetical protein
LGERKVAEAEAGRSRHEAIQLRYAWGERDAAEVVQHLGFKQERPLLGVLSSLRYSKHSRLVGDTQQRP